MKVINKGSSMLETLITLSMFVIILKIFLFLIIGGFKKVSTQAVYYNALCLCNLYHTKSLRKFINKFKKTFILDNCRYSLKINDNKMFLKVKMQDKWWNINFIKNYAFIK